jgi:hypothetical protein
MSRLLFSGARGKALAIEEALDHEYGRLKDFWRRRLWVLVKDVLFDLLQFGDLARHMLLAGREPLDAAHYLLLTGGDTGSDPKLRHLTAHGVTLPSSSHRKAVLVKTPLASFCWAWWKATFTNLV